MQQHDLHLSRHGGVAKGEIDRQRLVPAADIGRPVGALDLLVGKRFPYRSPFGARRGDDVIDVEITDGREDRIPAIDIVLHGLVSPVRMSPFAWPRGLSVVNANAIRLVGELACAS